MHSAVLGSFRPVAIRPLLSRPVLFRWPLVGICSSIQSLTSGLVSCFWVWFLLRPWHLWPQIDFGDPGRILPSFPMSMVLVPRCTALSICLHHPLTGLWRIRFFRHHVLLPIWSLWNKLAVVLAILSVYAVLLDTYPAPWSLVSWFLCLRIG